MPFYIYLSSTDKKLRMFKNHLYLLFIVLCTLSSCSALQNKKEKTKNPTAAKGPGKNKNAIKPYKDVI